MKAETDDMTDSAYFRVASLLKNKSARQIERVYKRADRQNKKSKAQKSLWARIKSFFLRGSNEH